MKQSNSECSVADWVKPPLNSAQMLIWKSMFNGVADFYAHYTHALHNKNSISVKCMEEFTQACVVARLKGELK